MPKFDMRLFWHQCVQARKLEAEPVTEYCSLLTDLRNNNVLDAKDGDYYLRDIRERTDLDDKRIALSVLFDVCNARENADLLESIRDVVNGNSDLEAEFDRLSTPPMPSEAYLEAQRRRSERRGAKTTTGNGEDARGASRLDWKG